MKKSIYTMYGKRIFDFVLASIAIVFSVPVFLIVGILIKADSKGSIIFKQRRVGKDRKIFIIYKFRSMYQGAERDEEKYKHLDITKGKTFKIPNDPRLTRFGKVLVRRGLDELPQLFNILKGEMSFVGPRPHLPKTVRCYEKWQFQRLESMPGLTSPWVINGKHWNSFDEWVKSDIKYIENISFSLDFKILRDTFLQFLGYFKRSKE